MKDLIIWVLEDNEIQNLEYTKMKAIILAAGYATRLYPLTKDKPKPLLEIKGRPIIDYIVEKLEKCNVNEVYVVTNEKFFTQFLDWKFNLNSKLNITIVNDKTKSNEDRLGSLGDINYVVDNLTVNDDIIVVAGDNLFEFEIKNLVDIFKEKNASIVALYDVRDTELAKLYGIVSVDNESKIVDFEEKPTKPKSTLSSTGVYLYPKDVIKKISEFVNISGKADKAGDFLQWLYKNEPVYCYVSEKKWFDIGSLNQLEVAKEEFLE